MKTSPTQFDMMVTFMEQHGDLSKPSTNPRGRIHNIEGWEELTSFLNSDPTGDAKNTEKWKKVWSDLKNNLKKKAGRINRAANGTGTPAIKSSLSNLEHRVLTIMGVQLPTGLKDVEEAGVKQETTTGVESVPPSTLPIFISSPPPDPIACSISIDVGGEQWDETDPSWQPHVALASTPTNTVQPSESGHTPCWRGLQGPCRRIPSTRVHDSNSQWRKLQQLPYENEQKRLQLIELQLQIQRDWLRITNRALHMLDMVVNKFCED